MRPEKQKRKGNKESRYRECSCWMVVDYILEIGDRLSVKSGLLGSVGTASDHVGNDSECH